MRSSERQQETAYHRRKLVGSVARVLSESIPLCSSVERDVVERDDDRLSGESCRARDHAGGVRSDVADPISYCQLEELMLEHGMAVDHAILTRWVITYAPACDQQFRRRHQPVGRSWRMDETAVRVNEAWNDLYRAGDKGEGAEVYRVVESAQGKS